MITNGSDSAAETLAHLLARAFEQDPPGRYFLLSHHRRREWTTISLHDQVGWFRRLLKEAFEGGAEIVSTSDGSVAAVWYPPDAGQPEVEPSDTSAYGGMQEVQQLAGKAKSRHLHGRKHWYLFLLGRDPQTNRTCSASELVRPYLEKAKAAKIPVWLEAGTLHAKHVYEHLGFKTVEELIVGRGTADRCGNFVDGGDGFPMWAMIFES
ncbi:MAG: hypothetical protein Q9169_004419 [Polycauliona sp. 2 TL-2023]